MGTDIHLEVERYDEEMNDWIDINKQALPYRGTLNHIYKNPDDGEEKAKISQEELQEMIFGYWNENPEIRCYMIFSLLADVRNGYGFAGVETYQKIIPIDSLRGFPNKSSFDEVFDEAEEWCHSFTYYSMKELLEHDGWNTSVQNTGYVPFNDWKEYVESQDTDSPLTAPKNYSGDVWGDGVEKYSMDDFENLEYNSGISQYIKGKWEERSPLKESGFCAWLHSETMKHLTEQYGSESIRINIYFDN